MDTSITKGSAWCRRTHRGCLELALQPLQKANSHRLGSCLARFARSSGRNTKGWYVIQRIRITGLKEIHCTGYRSETTEIEWFGAIGLRTRARSDIAVGNPISKVREIIAGKGGFQEQAASIVGTALENGRRLLYSGQIRANSKRLKAAATSL